MTITRHRFRCRAAAVLLAGLLVQASRLDAEASPQTPGPARPVGESVFRLTPQQLAAAIGRAADDTDPHAARQSMPGRGTFPRRPRTSSRTLRITSGIIGAVGGFFAGGVLGAKLEGPCACDDPGLTGFVVGAPVGAAVGGVVGAKFLWKLF